MSRLTTNKPVDECSMLELAYNSCYAKDGKARYRDYEMNMDARDFARNLMVTLTGEELPLDDEAFDEEMYDNLQYDQFSNVKGLIALFYRNLWAMADLRERLKNYEDKQEQGLLIELSCKVGTTVGKISGSYTFYLTECYVEKIEIDESGSVYYICTSKDGTYSEKIHSDKFRKSIFLTKALLKT